jgi:hypothetical protein
LLFFLVTFAVTWGLWLPAVFISRSSTGVPAVLEVLRVAGTYGPSLCALALVWLRRDEASIQAFLKRVVQLSGPVWVWLFAVLFVPMATGLGWLVNGIAHGSWPVPAFISDPLYLPLGILFVLFLGGPLGEELGWRGYALDRLAGIMRLFWGSVVLGLVWSAWHAPLFFIEGTTQQGFPVPLYMAFTVIQAILYSVLSVRSRGSILIAILFHLFGNLGLGLFPTLSQPTGMVVFAALYLVGAVVMVVANRKILFGVAS